MITELIDRRAAAKSGFADAYRENVIPDLALWSAKGQRCALVTLVGVDGNAPRAIGAQMAVAESGHCAGYISGGCLEQAIALEAMEVIQTGRPRLLRYGKGSPYFDIQLPCGSGLDVFIQPNVGSALVRSMACRLGRREPFALRIDLSTGAARIDSEVSERARSCREGNGFLKFYAPTIRCLIAGSSPIAVALSNLAACAGFETVLHVPDPEALPPLPSAVKVHALLPRAAFAADRWTAAVLAFHDHDRELPLLSPLLRSSCFFIGAIGSRRVYEARKAALAHAGFSASAIARIKSPAGVIAGLKTAPFAALSILAQIVAEGRAQDMIC